MGFDRFTGLMPLWALLAALLAYLEPAPFAARQALIVPLLGLAMLGMGMTLTIADLTAVLRRPGLIGLGVGLQYLIMPLAGWAIGVLLGLPPALLAGLVLVGACPGGTASNLICYLARGLGSGERTARTLAIEVGMQNSGLAVALATKHFSVAAALPAALFSIWPNLSGALLAGRWSRRQPAPLFPD